MQTSTGHGISASEQGHIPATGDKSFGDVARHRLPGAVLPRRSSPSYRRQDSHLFIRPSHAAALTLYRVEKRAGGLVPADRSEMRKVEARPILGKLHQYLLDVQLEVLPKSPSGRAVRYALKTWIALTR